MTTVKDAANAPLDGSRQGSGPRQDPGLGKPSKGVTDARDGQVLDVKRPGAARADVSDEGLTLEEYAKNCDLTEAEVWRRLRRGELVGRSQKGRLVIFKSTGAPGAVSAGEPLPSRAHEAARDLVDLPPLPGIGPERAGAESDGRQGGAYLTLSGERSPSPELALLLDHLSLAKEENREILKMTQESIRKVTELSDTIVGMKDCVIESKETQIMALREQLAARDHELKKLRQQNEDLEMLARAVAASTPKR